MATEIDDVVSHPPPPYQAQVQLVCTTESMETLAQQHGMNRATYPGDPVSFPDPPPQYGEIEDTHHASQNIDHISQDTPHVTQDAHHAGQHTQYVGQDAHHASTHSLDVLYSIDDDESVLRNVLKRGLKRCIAQVKRFFTRRR